MIRAVAVSALFASMAISSAAGQTPPPQPPALEVGTVAPAFSLKAATRSGVEATPVTLASLQGKTVILAFFPRARTGGCTAQMNAYKEKYEALFKGGNVKLFAVSTDADTTLAAWAAEKDYPITFLSDLSGDVSRAYHTARETEKYGTIAARVLYVIGPDGKIAHVMAPFRETDPTSYTALDEAITRISGGR